MFDIPPCTFGPLSVDWLSIAVPSVIDLALGGRIIPHL